MSIDRTLRLSLFALLLSAAACGSDDDKPKVDAASAPDGGGDAAGAPSVAKFCHTLTRAGMPVALTLEIGSPPVKLTAMSGQCAPMLPTACPMIPSGPMVPIRLLDDAQMPLLSGMGEIPPASELLFLASFNAAMMRPQIQYGRFMPQFKCDTTDPTARPDGGTMMGDGGMMTPVDGGIMTTPDASTTTTPDASTTTADAAAGG